MAREDRADLPANETGVAAIDARGQVLDAGWRRGVDEAVAWADAVANGGDAVMFVDAPLVVRNETGQRRTSGDDHRAGQARAAPLTAPAGSTAAWTLLPHGPLR